MTPPRAVAVVLRDDRVLVIKRHRDGVDYAVLPGGGVEPGESSAEAALRELHEETTLTAEIDRLLWTGDHGGRPASYFLMKEVTGEPVLSGRRHRHTARRTPSSLCGRRWTTWTRWTSSRKASATR